METLQKLDPSSMYLRGFDRRGCTASLNNATANGFQVSGIWSDVADFVVLMLFDADDLYGHLTTSRYLPDFSLRGMVLDFDLVTINCINPTFTKYASVPWGSLSYIKADGTTGSVALPTSAAVGGTRASTTFTIFSSSSPVAADRVQLIYFGNNVFDYIVSMGDTIAVVAAALVNQINGFNYIAAGVPPLTAVQNGSSFTVTYSLYGVDGNNIALLPLHKTSTTQISPSTNTYLIGGVDLTSVHIHLDFTSLGIDTVRQLWFTIAPSLPFPRIGDASGTTFLQMEFSWLVKNWVVTDPNGLRPLYIAGPNSLVIDSRSSAASYTGTWVTQTGFFYHGFAVGCSVSGGTVTITYTSAFKHNLYLGTVLYTGLGSFSISLDSVSYGTISTAVTLSSQIVTRRLLIENVAAGTHTIVLTTTSNATTYFDYLHVCVPSVPLPPLIEYDNLSAAFDFDTNQTWALAPARSVWILQQLGFRGDIDVYAGVFFKEVRTRYGGYFHTCTLTLSGSWATGTGVGDGDAVFITVAGTSYGAAFYPADTNTTVAQRLVNAVNSAFVGVRAVLTGTGVFTVTCLSPINGFTIAISKSAGATGTFTKTGDILAGNEGIWRIAAVNTNSVANFPLNRGFIDWLDDFADTTALNGLTFTLAFSQELLAPPDANTSGGAWIQRFSDGTTVLTATGFGIWGTGYIESYSVTSGVTTITSTAHGYITGNMVNIPAVPGSYTITVLSANTFSIPAAPTLAVLDQIYINLQTSQCNFNPATITAYMILVYKQASTYVARLQFGEVGWWFFNGGTGPSMAFYDAATSAAATVQLGRSLHTFVNPTDLPSVNVYQDADFLRGLLKSHIHSIRAAVLNQTFPSDLQPTEFELLYPYDVNWPVNYTNVQYPYNIGGALNNYINLPWQYLSPEDDIDLFKLEALAWSTSYRTLDNVAATLLFPSTYGLWEPGSLSYLIPVDNGGCAWLQELNLAIESGIGNICLWAIDHIILLSWPVPIPLIPLILQEKSYFQPLTSTSTYLRNFLNDLIGTATPNTPGQ